jgi:uncharacterized protein
MAGGPHKKLGQNMLGSNTMLSRILSRLSGNVLQHPRWFVWPQIIFAGLCVLYAFYGLGFDANRDHLIGAGVAYHERYLNFTKEFPGEDQLVIAEGADWERNRQFIERLAARMKTETNLFTGIFYKADLPTLGPKALQLAPAEDLEQMRKIIRTDLPFLRDFAQATNLNSLFAMINRQFLGGEGKRAGDRDALLKAIPAMENILTGMQESLTLPGRPPPPEIETVFGGGGKAAEHRYITFEDGRIFTLAFRPVNEESAPQGIERLRKLITETEGEVPGVNAGLTGGLVLNYDEKRQSERDSIIAGVAALMICSLIFIIAYREIGAPLRAALCLLIGFGYTLGFTTLAVGHLNILSVTFAPMLIGLAIDYGVQFITRYEEELRHGRTLAEAITKAMVFTGQGIVIGGLTTGTAFLAMGLTRFKGIREVGIICGGGLLLCLIPMMTMLPALLVMGHPHTAREEVRRRRPARLRMETLWLRHSLLVAGCAVVLCGVAAWQAEKVTFDYNLLHLQARNMASVRFENKLMQSAGRSVMFAAVIADSPQQARQFEERVKGLPSVSRVESAADYFSDTQEDRKLEAIRGIKSELAGVEFAPLDRRPVQPQELSATLWYLKGYLGLAADATRKKQPELSRQLLSFQGRIIEFRRTLTTGDPQIPEQLGEFQEALFTNLRGMIEALKTQDTSGPLRPADLPAVLRDRFIGVTGHYLLQVYPKKDIWQHDNQREFIRQLEAAVSPERVTGQPTQIYEYSTLLKTSYQQAAWYSLGAIVIMLLLHFRSPGYVVLALLPVGIGFIWLLGFMGAAGLAFNPANIMTLPLVVGIGVTNGVQVLNRVAEERQPAVLSKSTGKAVLVSGLTAIAGFGALLLARHQGIKSLGEIMPVGIATCMIAGLTVLPAVLTLLARSGAAWESARREHDLHAAWRRLRWHRH